MDELEAEVEAEAEAEAAEAVEDFDATGWRRRGPPSTNSPPRTT